MNLDISFKLLSWKGKNHIESPSIHKIIIQISRFYTSCLDTEGLFEWNFLLPLKCLFYIWNNYLKHSCLEVLQGGKSKSTKKKRKKKKVILGPVMVLLYRFELVCMLRCVVSLVSRGKKWFRFGRSWCLSGSFFFIWWQCWCCDIRFWNWNKLPWFPAKFPIARQPTDQPGKCLCFLFQCDSFYP